MQIDILIITKKPIDNFKPRNVREKREEMVQRHNPINSTTQKNKKEYRCT